MPIFNYEDKKVERKKFYIVIINTYNFKFVNKSNKTVLRTIY